MKSQSKWLLAVTMILAGAALMAANNSEDNLFTGRCIFKSAIVADGGLRDKIRVVDFNTTSTIGTAGCAVSNLETGTTFRTTTASSDDTVTFKLPPPVVGNHFIFKKSNTTSSSVLCLTAPAGVTINGGTAAKSWKCTSTGLGDYVHVYAKTSTTYITLEQVGTWVADNSAPS